MKKILKELLPFVIVVIIVLLIKAFVISPIRVDGDSMKNTLHDGDYMILDKITYRFKDIKRFDIVVIKYKNSYLIKRVIGLPGEHIKYQDNKLYVNGKEVKEKFSHKKTYDYDLKHLESDVVPKDKFFVLGDNRTDSLDSRSIGFVDKENILGHATLTLFPLNRFGVKK